jgi:hypothetical protein
MDPSEIPNAELKFVKGETAATCRWHEDNLAKNMRGQEVFFGRILLYI